MCTRRTDARVGREMSKPMCGEAAWVGMMCAAARVDPETGSRCYGQIWGASRAVALAMRPEQREALMA